MICILFPTYSVWFGLGSKLQKIPNFNLKIPSVGPLSLKNYQVDILLYRWFGNVIIISSEFRNNISIFNPQKLLNIKFKKETVIIILNMKLLTSVLLRPVSRFYIPYHMPSLRLNKNREILKALPWLQKLKYQTKNFDLVARDFSCPAQTKPGIHGPFKHSGTYILLLIWILKVIEWPDVIGDPWKLGIGMVMISGMVNFIKNREPYIRII